MFAEDRHALLAKMPWFRAPGYRGKGSKRASGAKCTKASAERELAGATGEAGSFVVRVIEGDEMREIPSKFHKGKPGNYITSTRMETPDTSMQGGVRIDINHLMILPSW